MQVDLGICFSQVAKRRLVYFAEKGDEVSSNNLEYFFQMWDTYMAKSVPLFHV